MDNQPINEYNKTATEIAEFHNSLIPEKIYRLINEFFIPEGVTGDIGCGAGRDCQWLFEHGYITSGIDAATGMLNQARKRYPGVTQTLMQGRRC